MAQIGILLKLGVEKFLNFIIIQSSLKLCNSNAQKGMARGYHLGGFEIINIIMLTALLLPPTMFHLLVVPEIHKDAQV